jgi:Ger(x)C family germination protein
MKGFRTLGILVSIILILNGCSKTPEIQNMAYATAIGVDFEKGKWIAYAQILNFANISHSEQVNIGNPVPIWVGKGKGDTVALALTDISRTSQLHVFWGHVNAVVMTEAVLKKGVSAVYSAINRYREVRYNILVYGTKRELPEILTQKSLLNLSPLSTIMFTATQSDSPYSIIMPVTGNRVIANLNEPGEPGLIPSIDIDSKDWTEDQKVKPMFNLSGGYFFQNNKMIGWMSEKDLQGMRWTEEKLERMPLQVDVNGSPAAVVMCSTPKMLIKPVKVKGDLKFNIEVDAKGYVMELLQDVPMEQLKRQAAETIRKEMIATYLNAIKVRCDPFRLRQSLYRSDPAAFHRLFQMDTFFLRKDSIGEIHVHIHLMNTGKYKGTEH